MDKNKILDAAAKLVAKGAYDKAIKEYTKVLDADPKDVRVLHKLGELYEKKNDSAQAATYFTRVADGYANDGFSMKAIALYKKVLKLDPNLIDVNLKLAELHQQHQLMSEAMAYFQAVANHYDKGGNVRASLDILKKMVDLDPDNVSSRIKLAELYAREQMNTEATQEFRRAAEYLKRNNRTDDYLRVAERLSALDPNNMELARELAQEFLSKGDQKRALAKLQVCFKADPRDIQTLTLLAEAFQGLGQTSKTVSVYKELAKIHQEQGRADEANRTWTKISQLDPNDPDVQARAAPKPQPQAPQAPQRPAPQPEPQPQPQPQARAQPAAPAAPQPAQAAAAGGLSRDQLSKLLTETDVYVKYGLHDKALEHLRRIFGVDPENLDAHEKAYQIYVAANNGAAASEQLLNVLRLCTRRQDVERAQPYLAAILQQNPNHPEVPAFLAVLRTGNMAAPQPQVEQLPEEAILVDSSEDEIIVADAPEDALLADEDLALSAAQNEEVVAEDVIEEASLEPVSSEYDAPVEEQIVSDEVVADPVFADAVEDEPLVGDAADDEPLMIEEPVSAEIVVDDPAFDDVVATEELPALGDEHEAPTNVRAQPESILRMARVEQPPEPPPAFAVAEEPVYDEVAEEPAYGDAAEELGYELPDDPSDVAAAELEVATAAYEVAEEPAAVEEPVEAAAEEEEPAAEECDEAQFFLDQGLFEEAREILETVTIAFPGHVRASQMMAALEAAEAGGAPMQAADEPVEDAQPPVVQPVTEEPAYAAAEGDGDLDAFDLAAELASELGEAAEESQSGSFSTGDDYQVSVEEVFSEFKKGLEKIVKPEDVDTHYDLGIAYKEMGLFDDAIGEFSVARQGCVGKKKEIDCLTMIGLLYMMKGEATNAVDAFKQALANENTTPDSANALRFELASAWESAGSPGRALFHMQAVYDVDPKYRDVAANLQRLAGMASPEEDPLPTPGGAAPKNGSHAPGNGSGAVATGAQTAGAPKQGPKAGKVGYV